MNPKEGENGWEAFDQESGLWRPCEIVGKADDDNDEWVVSYLDADEISLEFSNRNRMRKKCKGNQASGSTFHRATRFKAPVIIPTPKGGSS
jgi:hypothetical protein